MHTCIREYKETSSIPSASLSLPLTCIYSLTHMQYTCTCIHSLTHSHTHTHTHTHTQPTACFSVCHHGWHCWDNRSLATGESSHRCSRHSKHHFIRRCLHAPQKSQHHQHLGWFSRRSNPTSDGLVSVHWKPRVRCVRISSNTVCVAICSLQRSELEPAIGLHSCWLPDDVCH